MLKFVAPLAAALVLAAAPAQAQDAAAGKRAFLKCVACHSIAKGAPNKIGPNLFGVVGRKAGTAPGFRYSAAMKAKGAAIVWNPATLDNWLARPSAVIPGTSMAFGGVPNAAERAAIIAYLKKPMP
ncbi:cytochrome c family protein (plasmid) [Novosphingobium sp. THN1]|uniref:c-type cytochrome n=1 Tax=Novosphingobium sp. THN1 TaxID=1016987 RepID=UPI000E4D4106|nr:cytochrome c family protein [Novosphingobium sp. THN1]AXU21589.1 cytochrome c family protein [Novosphingobium sp. THN1]